MIRHRPAPSAMRREISRDLTIRTSKHEISPDWHRRSRERNQPRPTWTIDQGCVGAYVELVEFPDDGEESPVSKRVALSSRRPMVSISARALSMVMPSVTRPKTNQVSRASRLRTLGVGTNAPIDPGSAGSKKPLAMTPITVVRAPFIRTVRPMMVGSFPYRRSQKP